MRRIRYHSMAKNISCRNSVIVTTEQCSTVSSSPHYLVADRLEHHEWTFLGFDPSSSNLGGAHIRRPDSARIHFPYATATPMVRRRANASRTNPCSGWFHEPERRSSAFVHRSPRSLPAEDVENGQHTDKLASVLEPPCPNKTPVPERQASPRSRWSHADGSRP